MKRLPAWMFLILSIPCVAHTGEAHFTVFGSGLGTNSIRAMAVAQAFDKAKATVTADCKGEVTEIELEGTECYGSGGKSRQICIVRARAACTVELAKHFKTR